MITTITIWEGEKGINVKHINSNGATMSEMFSLESVSNSAIDWQENYPVVVKSSARVLNIDLNSTIKVPDPNNAGQYLDVPQQCKFYPKTATQESDAIYITDTQGFYLKMLDVCGMNHVLFTRQELPNPPVV